MENATLFRHWQFNSNSQIASQECSLVTVWFLPLYTRFCVKLFTSTSSWVNTREQWRGDQEWMNLRNWQNWAQETEQRQTQQHKHTKMGNIHPRQKWVWTRVLTKAKHEQFLNWNESRLVISTFCSLPDIKINSSTWYIELLEYSYYLPVYT